MWSFNKHFPVKKTAVISGLPGWDKNTMAVGSDKKNNEIIYR
jgi:hypothetical protein